MKNTRNGSNIHLAPILPASDPLFVGETKKKANGWIKIKINGKKGHTTKIQGVEEGTVWPGEGSMSVGSRSQGSSYLH